MPGIHVAKAAKIAKSVKAQDHVSGFSLSSAPAHREWNGKGGFKPGNQYGKRGNKRSEGQGHFDFEKPELPVSAKETQSTFKPAKTIEEAEDFLRSKGVEPHWRNSDKTERPDTINLEDINHIHEKLDSLWKQYPEVDINHIGTYYGHELNDWEKRYSQHFEEDRKDFDRKGKRWREPQAHARVSKLMSSKPTFESDGAWGAYDAASLARYHWYGAKTLTFNHVTIFKSTTEKVESNRKKMLDRGEDLFTIGDDMQHTTTHEFGHAIDDHYDISRHPMMKDYHKSLSEKEIHGGLSMYASSNIKEFVAEGFTEGSRPDARPMGKKVKLIMDKIIAEKKAQK